MRILTKRFEAVQVITMASLREHLETLSTPDCKYAIEKVRGAKVFVRAEARLHETRVRPAVVLPTYPTGHAHDDPVNPNVVLDPMEFVDAETPHKRALILPLLGEEVMRHYDKMHPAEQLQMTRCC